MFTRVIYLVRIADEDTMVYIKIVVHYVVRRIYTGIA